MSPVTSAQKTVISITNDLIIRKALTEKLVSQYSGEEDLKIIPELGVRHGAVRIDIAVVNGVMHGYEIKSDRDTLHRLPEQMEEYSAVFDQVTLVVGKKHIYEAIKKIPDWWGVLLAKVDSEGNVFFQSIREARNNKEQKKESIARLLWRAEALKILEEKNGATGFRSKPRRMIYARLAEILDLEVLKSSVRNTLLTSRIGWRPDVQLVLGDD